MSRLAFAAVAAFVVVVGCQTADVGTPTYQFGLFPKVAHSGFNATARFNIVYATSARDPQWTVDDPSIATVVPTDPPSIPNTDVSKLRFALVTTTKAGETRVNVTSGGTTLSAQLVVKGYSNEQLALGKTRYEAASTDSARTPCASCHQKPGGVDHSPLKMAGFDDPTILGVIQDATYPAVTTGSSTTSAFAPSGPLSLATHKWNLTEPEKDGILSYLRSLPLGKVTPVSDAGAPADASVEAGP